MINYLKEYNVIDFKRLLVLRSKELGLSSDETITLLTVMELKNVGVKSITPTLLQNYLSFTNKQLDIILYNLMTKKIITNKFGTIHILEIEAFLLNNKTKKELPIDLISSFEQEFGRSLSPMEISLIKEWSKEYKGDDSIIFKALKEAVKSNVITFRYIEAILNNWKKNGVKTRYIEDQEDVVEVSHYDWLNQ